MLRPPGNAANASLCWHARTGPTPCGIPAWDGPGTRSVAAGLDGPDAVTTTRAALGN